MPLTIRPATPDDYDAYAALLPELRVDDPIPPRARWVSELLPTTLIAEDHAVVGYLYHQTFGSVGYVRNVVSDPAHRRLGIGRALMEAARELFRAQGATAWCLNVKPDNVPARALYDALGFRVAYESKALRISWEKVRAWPSPERVVSVRAVAPPEDEALERSQGLLLGQLASARAQPGRIILGLWERDQPAGVLVFNPHYPGCFPFRLDDPALLPPFLAALHGYRRPEHAWVQVVIEGQAELAEALTGLGAELRLEILNLRAPL